MNELMVVEKLAEWQRLKALVLDSVSSPITRRVYNMALDEFVNWFKQEPRPGFTKATVSVWRASLEARGLGSSSIIIRMSAVRKLAAEAADNGLLAPELAAGIARVKSAKSVGIRSGNWLSLRQAQALLSAPDIATVKGLRDRAILAVLLGCGLRRSEVAALSFAHIQQRDGRWCVVDLIGKHGRVRTIPMPTWVKVAIDAWASAAGLVEGRVFRPVNRGDRIGAEGLSEKVVWQLLQPYAQAAGVPGASRRMTVAAMPNPGLCRMPTLQSHQHSLARLATRHNLGFSLIIGEAPPGCDSSVPFESRTCDCGNAPAGGHFHLHPARGNPTRPRPEGVVQSFCSYCQAPDYAARFQRADVAAPVLKLCRVAGGELEQLQLLLGHASVQTTERYLGTKQDLVHAPNGAIKLKLTV